MHKARKPIAAHKRKSSYKEEQDNSKLSKLDLTSDEGFLPLIAGTSGLHIHFQTFFYMKAKHCIAKL